MGWNSWNCWACAVDEKKIRESGRGHGQIRAHQSRLAVYQYRRLLDDPPQFRRRGGRRRAARRSRPHPDQQALPGHEGPDRLRPRPGPQDRHVHLAGPVDLRGLRGKLAARAVGRPPVRRRGASIISSTTGAATAPSRRARRWSRCRSRTGSCGCAWTAWTATSSTASASTAWATSGNGARRSAATAGGPPATSPTPGAAWRHRVRPGGPRPLRQPGPLERSRHARGRPGRLGPEPAGKPPDAQRAIHAHQPVVPAQLAAADRLRPDPDRRVHDEPADQ